MNKPIKNKNKIKALSILWFWGFHASENHEHGKLSDYMYQEVCDKRLTKNDAFQVQEYLRHEMLKIGKRIGKLKEK